MIEISEEIKEKIKIHALDESPKECCGFIFKDNIFPCLNISPEPYDTFIIKPLQIIEAESLGNVVAYYHSHVKSDENFTVADKLNSEYMNLPLYVYSCVTDKFNVYYPRGFEASLEGRPFVWGITDCCSLCSDYYKQNCDGGMAFDVSRYNADEVIQKRLLEDGISKMKIGKDGKGFFINIGSDINNAQKNDLLAMVLNKNDIIDHLGIYLGNGEMLHHLAGHESCKSYLSQFWIQRIKSIWRIMYND